MGKLKDISEREDRTIAEYKVKTYQDTGLGRIIMEGDINKMAKEGWEVDKQEQSGQGYSIGKTVALGAIFLPLALAGKKKDKITITYKRDLV